MSIKQFNETTLPTMYCADLLSSKNMNWKAGDSYAMFDVTIQSIAAYLAANKSKDHPVAVAIKDLKGNFKMGGKVQYVENENPELPGNWTFILTFNEDEIQNEEKTVQVCDANENKFIITIANEAAKLYGLEFGKMEYVYPPILQVAETLINYLDSNAVETDVIEVESPGYFKASVSIENGLKVMSITPDGAMKRLVKGDADLEK